jgi:hypothetical protein
MLSARLYCTGEAKYRHAAEHPLTDRLISHDLNKGAESLALPNGLSEAEVAISMTSRPMIVVRTTVSRLSGEAAGSGIIVAG